MREKNTQIGNAPEETLADTIRGLIKWDLGGFCIATGCWDILGMILQMFFSVVMESAWGKVPLHQRNKANLFSNGWKNRPGSKALPKRGCLIIVPIDKVSLLCNANRELMLRELNLTLVGGKNKGSL